MTTTTAHPVLTPPPASPALALERAASRLRFETDCADVHAALALDEPGFVLLDVRSEEAFARGHVPGAVHLPHDRIGDETLAGFPAEALFVVYCSGPHCNGSTRAAIRLSRLGRPTKEMIGGFSGWQDSGYEVATR